jgi:acetyl-CoA acetyltransferase
MVSPPLGLLDCSSFACGAAAVVVAEENLATGTRKRPVAIRGFGEAHDPSHFVSVKKSVTHSQSASVAAGRAFENAGVKPSDIDVAEVYGVFSATELILYESLGFFEKGRAAFAVRDGKTSGQGKIVFNPSGGRLSLGHPAGATPLYSAVEIVEQLRGESGRRQVRNARLGLIHAEHGKLDGNWVAILEAT